MPWHVWGPEDKLWESLFSFHYADCRNQTWIIRLGSKCFSPLNYHALFLRQGLPQHLELAAAARNGWLGNSRLSLFLTPQCQDCRHMGLFSWVCRGPNSEQPTLSTNPSYMPGKDIFNVTYAIAITLHVLFCCFLFNRYHFLKIYINLHNLKIFTLLFNIFHYWKLFSDWCDVLPALAVTSNSTLNILIPVSLFQTGSLHSPDSPETYWVYTCIFNFARVSL